MREDPSGGLEVREDPSGGLVDGDGGGGGSTCSFDGSSFCGGLIRVITFLWPPGLSVILSLLFISVLCCSLFLVAVSFRLTTF